MSSRIRGRSRLGVVASVLLLACTSKTTPDTGGSGSSAAGTAGSAAASAGRNAGGSSTTGGGGVTGGSAGSASGGLSNAGSAGNASGGLSSAGSSPAGNGGLGGSGGTGSRSKTTFFVTSDTSMTGMLGGLEGADKRCQALAEKAGIGDHTFHAYLSTSTVNAKDRIGAGPWMNANGLLVAESVAALHAPTLKGDHTIFVDEKGMPIHGQWDGGPVEHDILTGSKADGTLQSGLTCMDWTSSSAGDKAQVGHSDGEGPGMATTGTYSSWNSAHANGGCNDTKPLGGAGRLYCFAID